MKNLKKVLAAARKPKPRSRHMHKPKPSTTGGPAKSRTKVKKGVVTAKTKPKQKKIVRIKGPTDQRESVSEHLILSRQTWKSIRGLQSAGESSLGGVKGRLAMMIVGLVNVVVKLVS